MKQNIQNKTLSEFYTDDKKSKYSSNPTDILKSAKNFYKSFIQMRKRSKLSLLNFEKNKFIITWQTFF